MSSTKLSERGCYESWPLYLGYYHGLMIGAESWLRAKGRSLGLALRIWGGRTALMVVDGSGKYERKILNLSPPTTRTLSDVARVVSDVRERKVEVKIGGRYEYMQHYVSMGKIRRV